MVGPGDRNHDNRNVVCAPHVDRNNSEYSWIIFLGTFEGGALLFEDGQRIEKPYERHRIRASELLHWNEPITSGTKFSVILYRKRLPKPNPPRMPGAVEFEDIGEERNEGT